MSQINMPRLKAAVPRIAIGGLMGNGKTTTAAAVLRACKENGVSGVLIDSDSFRKTLDQKPEGSVDGFFGTLRILEDIARQHEESGKFVIVTTMFLNKRERELVVDPDAAHHKGIWLFVEDPEICNKRVEERSSKANGNPSTAPVGFLKHARANFMSGTEGVSQADLKDADGKVEGINAWEQIATDRPKPGDTYCFTALEAIVDHIVKSLNLSDQKKMGILARAKELFVEQIENPNSSFWSQVPEADYEAGAAEYKRRQQNGAGSNGHFASPAIIKAKEQDSAVKS